MVRCVCCRGQRPNRCISLNPKPSGCFGAGGTVLALCCDGPPVSLWNVVGRQGGPPWPATADHARQAGPPCRLSHTPSERYIEATSHLSVPPRLDAAPAQHQPRHQTRAVEHWRYLTEASSIAKRDKAARLASPGPRLMFHRRPADGPADCTFDEKATGHGCKAAGDEGRAARGPDSR